MGRTISISVELDKTPPNDAYGGYGRESFLESGWFIYGCWLPVDADPDEWFCTYVEWPRPTKEFKDE